MPLIDAAGAFELCHATILSILKEQEIVLDQTIPSLIDTKTYEALKEALITARKLKIAIDSRGVQGTKLKDLWDLSYSDPQTRSTKIENPQRIVLEFF